jgi:hypothetical protein
VEFPHYEKIYRDYKDKGLSVIAVNDIDPQDEMVDFMTFNDVKQPMAMDFNGLISYFYKAKTYGTVVVVDAESRRIKYIGTHDWRPIRAALKELKVF